MRLLLVSVIIVSFLSCSGCATNPVGKWHVTTSEDHKIQLEPQCKDSCFEIWEFLENGKLNRWNIGDSTFLNSSLSPISIRSNSWNVSRDILVIEKLTFHEPKVIESYKVTKTKDGLTLEAIPL